jgi:hypothetical protein
LNQGEVVATEKERAAHPRLMMPTWRKQFRDAYVVGQTKLQFTLSKPWEQAECQIMLQSWPLPRVQSRIKAAETPSERDWQIFTIGIRDSLSSIAIMFRNRSRKRNSEGTKEMKQVKRENSQKRTNTWLCK